MQEKNKLLKRDNINVMIAGVGLVVLAFVVVVTKQIFFPTQVPPMTFVPLPQKVFTNKDLLHIPYH